MPGKKSPGPAPFSSSSVFFRQEFIYYHNSMLFPSFPMPGSPLEVRLPSWEILQETTARLLFMAVRWVRCLVPFQTLSKNDQQLLLQVIISAVIEIIFRGICF